MVEDTRQLRRWRLRHHGPPVTYSAREVIRVAIGSGGMGLVIGLVGSSFSTSGIVSMTVAATMLLIAWAIGAVAITVSEPVWGLASNYRVVISLSCIVLLAAGLSGIGLYQSKHMPVVDKGTARVVIDQATFERLPGQTVSRIDVALKDNGTAVALEYTLAVAGKVVTEKTLSPDQITAYMEKVRHYVVESDANGPHHLKLIPGINQLVWLSDIENINKDFIFLNESQIGDFNNGKLGVYIFLFGRYEDETITGSAYWEIQSCGIYTATLAYLHNCPGAPKLDKIDGSRFH